MTKRRRRAAEHNHVQHLDDLGHESGSHPNPHQDAAHRESAATLPGRSVQRELLDLYFSHTFNSTLVFDRTSVDREWADERLAEPGVLAICSMATVYACLLSTRVEGEFLIEPRFLHPSSVLIQQNGTILEELGENYRFLARQWALQAGGLILQKVDQPTLEIVQVCQVLGLFWFAVGEVQRHSMLTGSIGVCSQAQALYR